MPFEIAVDCDLRSVDVVDATENSSHSGSRLVKPMESAVTEGKSGEMPSYSDGSSVSGGRVLHVIRAGRQPMSTQRSLRCWHSAGSSFSWR